MPKAKKQTSTVKQELEATKGFLSSIIGLMPSGLIVVDRVGHIVAINNQALRMIGKTRSQITGVDVKKVLAHIPKLREHVKSVCTPERTEFDVSSFRVQEGNQSTYISAHGKLLKEGCLILLENVTSQFSEVDKIKSEFVSMASHQLRTPLTSIRWYIEEVLDEELGSLKKEQKEYLAQALDSTSRMINLVRNLLNISRLEAGKVAIDPEPTDIMKLIQSVIAEHLPLARAKNCGIILHKRKQKVPKVNVDQALITQVISNLISNSVKYSSGKHGLCTVEVSVTQHKKFLEVEVKDMGVGIPRAMQSRIFEKFFRADNVTKLEAEGTGLGLYIAKMIVEVSGGSMRFESPVYTDSETGERRGTKFVFTLPIKGSAAKKGSKKLQK